MKTDLFLNCSWKIIKVCCPHCKTYQTVNVVVNSCFYCKKGFFVDINGNPFKYTKGVGLDNET